MRYTLNKFIWHLSQISPLNYNATLAHFCRCMFLRKVGVGLEGKIYTCHPTVCFTHSTQDVFPLSLLHFQIGPTLLPGFPTCSQIFLKFSDVTKCWTWTSLHLRYLALCSLWACQRAGRYFLYDPPVWLGLGLQLRCSLRDHRKDSLFM